MRNNGLNRLQAALYSAAVCIILMVVIIAMWYKTLSTPMFVDTSAQAQMSTGQSVTAPPPETTRTTVQTTPTTTVAPTSVSPEGVVTYADEVHPKRAYLTFDDGPSENTAAILDILDRYNVKGNFFVVGGRKAERYKLIVDRGHVLALHSMTHSYSKIYRSVDAYFADLCELENYVYAAAGVRPKIIRFPGGSSNTVSNKYCNGIMKTLVKEVESRGYVYYDWTIDSSDADDNNVPANQILDKIKAECVGRSNVNILMHDSGSTKQTTVEALPGIIEYLKSEGFTILPITEGTKPVHHRVG